MPDDSWTRLFNRYLSDLARVAKMFSAAKTPSELRALSNDPKFLKLADTIAKRFAAAGNEESAKTWREAARKSGRGAMFYRALQKEMRGAVGTAVRQTVHENASLISTLPIKLAREASAYILARQQEGLRAEEITKALRRWFPHVAESRLALIARTQVSSSATALSKARSEELGVTCYSWTTSRDERVRRSHQFMEGVVCFWDDNPAPERLIGEKNPPPPYACGMIYNCRCSPAPVISLDELSFPVRVARQGRVERMTRAAFKKLYEQPIAA